MIEEFIKTVVLTGMGIQKKALETVEEMITHRSPDSFSHERMADDFIKEATVKETDKPSELLEKIDALQNEIKEIKNLVSSQEERISKLEKS